MAWRLPQNGKRRYQRVACETKILYVGYQASTCSPTTVGEHEVRANGSLVKSSPRGWRALGRHSTHVTRPCAFYFWGIPRRSGVPLVLSPGPRTTRRLRPIGRHSQASLFRHRCQLSLAGRTSAAARTGCTRTPTARKRRPHCGPAPASQAAGTAARPPPSPWPS
jgi:hypothetical protein